MKFFTLVVISLSILSVAAVPMEDERALDRKPGIVHEPAATPQGENAHLYDFILAGGDAASDE